MAYLISREFRFQYLDFVMDLLLGSFFAAEQGETGKASWPIRAVLPAPGPLPHAFRLDRHPPDEHRQQCRQPGERYRAGDKPIRLGEP